MLFGWDRSAPKESSNKTSKKLIGLHKVKGCENPNRVADVVFVHGLGGNALSTWHPQELENDDNFWLNWLWLEHPDIGIWSFGYEAEPFAWRGKAMPLFDQASNLLAWLEVRRSEEQRPLILVTHNLGGLLVKKMLRTAQTFKKQEILEQIKGIVFLATPHQGSHLANLIQNIGVLTRTTISVEELKAHSTELADLNEWYRENVRSLSIATEVCYETKPIYGVLVVNRDSANPGIEGVKPVAVEVDHITIAKPDSRDSLVYLRVNLFIEKHLLHSEKQMSSDLAISVSVSNSLTEDAVSPIGYLRNEQEKTVTYQIEETENEQYIFPKMEYLEKIKSGIPIASFGGALRLPPYFKWQFPNLDLRLVNNADKTLYITNIFFEVEKSVLDPYPILVIPNEEPNALHFYLENEGWGEVKDPIVRFNLVPKGYSFSFEEPYQHQIVLDSFLEECNVDLSDALRTMGVDVDFLNGYNQYEQRSAEYEPMAKALGNYHRNVEAFSKDKESDEYKRLSQVLGIFINSDNSKRPTYSAVAYGEISFMGTTVDGELKHGSVKFSAEVVLLIPGGYGAPVGPSYQYATKLDIGRENYRVKAECNGSSISQYLKSGDVDRFNILVGADKSSLHIFRLRLVYNDDQSLLSKRIRLHIFVPRSEATSIRSLDNLRVEQGKGLASVGRIDDAIVKFQDAVRFNSALNFNPVSMAQQFSAPYLIEEANKSLKEREVQRAVDLYAKAKQFDPSLRILVYAWKTPNGLEVYAPEELSPRISIANHLYENIIGISELGLIWNPVNDPPSLSEILIWFWVIRPDLWEPISDLALPNFKEAIEYYNHYSLKKLLDRTEEYYLNEKLTGEQTEEN
jgi:tetratricopeptide (TPR) repeat protein